MTSEAGTVIYASTESRRSRHRKQPSLRSKAGCEPRGDDLRKHLRISEIEACQEELLPWVPVIKKLHVLHANLMHDLPRDHPARVVLEALQQRLFRPLQTIMKKDLHSVTAADVVTMRNLAKNVPSHLESFQKFMKTVKHTAKSTEDYYSNLRADFLNFQGAFGRQPSSQTAVAA